MDGDPLLDERQFMAMRDALREDFHSIMEEFFESCEGFKGRLEDAVKETDAGQFREVCHEIKGASGLLGLRAIAQAAAGWEAAAINGQLPTDIRLVGNFEQLVINTKAHVDSLK
jgi:HPt (histidine-containing phosphotransfer) domain-containing protein